MKPYSQLTIIELIKKLREQEELALDAHVAGDARLMEDHHQEIYRIYAAIGYRYSKIR